MDNQTTCNLMADRVFGPQVTNCRGNFDFTLLFEQSVLSVGPSAILLLILPFRFSSLYRSQIKIGHTRLRFLKLISTAASVCLQVALLILWASPGASDTQASIAAACLSLAAAIGICILSYLEHTRSIQPSEVLNLYLFFSVAFDAVQVRTLWLRNESSTIAAVFTASMATKLVLLLLEMVEKRPFLLPGYQKLPLESTSGILNRSVFWWLNTLITHGARSILSLNDLEGLDYEMSTKTLFRRLHEKWLSATIPRRHTLVLSVFSCQKKALAAGIFPRLCLTGFTYAQPFLIDRMITFTTEPTTQSTTKDGYGLIAATFLIYTGLAISRGQYKHKIYRTITMVRGSLISMIFDKMLKVDVNTLDDSASVTLMSTDVDRITTGLEDLHEIWASPIDVGIAAWLLERQVGWVAVVPIIVALSCIIAMVRLSQYTGPRQKRWNEAIQKRVAVTSSALSSMKAVKMLGMSDILSGDIQSLRDRELNLSKAYRVLTVWLNVIAYIPAVVSPFLTFTLLAFFKRSGTNLNVAQAFTSLSLISLLAAPLQSLLGSLPYFATAIACFDRIETYLNSLEKPDNRQVIQSLSAPSRIVKAMREHSDHSKSIMLQDMIFQKSAMSGSRLPHSNIISISNASFGTDSLGRPILSDVSLEVRRSSFHCIIGTVGSGKSTLLKALLGETTNSSGSVKISTHDIAYCDQQSWLVNGNLKKNIIGESIYDKAWYDCVVHACSLEEDIAQLSHGDLTMVGSKGITLSGGQKQRVALARAVYSRREILLLDDVLSGLDGRTIHVIFKRLLGRQGLLRKSGVTVILATHAVNHLHYADNIIIIGTNRKVESQGTFQKLNMTDPYFRSLLLKNHEPGEESILNSDQHHQPNPRPPYETNTVGSTSEGELSRASGDITLYKYYAQSIGGPYCFIFLSLFICTVFFMNFPQVWLRLYSESETRNPGSGTAKYLSVYAILTFLASLSSGVTIWFWFVKVVPRSALKLHWVLLQAVARAPLTFFSTTDTGITLNRFSQDMRLVDMTLPSAAYMTVGDMLRCLMQAILIAAGASFLGVLIPGIACVIYFLQKHYLKTSRQLRLLDLEAQSPLYTQFVESFNGLITIRAFGWQDAIRSHNIQLVDAAQRPYYLLFCIQRWLNLVLDMLVAGVAVLLVTFATQLRSSTSAGAIGVAFVSVLSFNQSLADLVTNWTALETSLGAISRLKTFVAETPVEETDNENRIEPPETWPDQGSIELKNVSFSYQADTELILKSISLSVKKGDHIAVCGRTGSGKSSFVLAILQLLESRGGSITIDGIDISTISRQAIRSSLTSIPQEPFFLAGSIKYNLDYTGHISDEAMIEALVKVGIWSSISARGGLDADMEAMALSHGEQQLFSFACAMLRKSTILILDEATSSLDTATDAMVQRLIHEEFKDYTVIAVAHRLSNIMQSDKIAILDRGSLVAYDTPASLLAGCPEFKALHDSLT